VNIQRFFDDGTATRLAEAANLLARYRYQIWRYGDSIGFERLLRGSQPTGEEIAAT
jgi:hypothetical protein